MATVTAAEPILEAEPIALPNDALYEVIDGRIVEKSSMGTYPVELASIIQDYLGPFARRAGLGRAIIEVLFRIDARTQYRPDLAFVSHAKWPLSRRAPKKEPWEIVPDLAIEVISETDKCEDVLSKTRDYFRAGVRAVWLVYPNLEVIHIFDSFTQIRVLTRDQVLEGGDLIPGFRLPLVDLFLEETEGEATIPTA
jgi:Uma2 family endonuclease